MLQLDNCFNQSVSSLRKLVGCIDMIDSVDRGTVSNGVGGTGASPPTESLEPLQAYAKSAEELLGNETSLHVGAGQSLQTAEARTCGAVERNAQLMSRANTEAAHSVPTD